MGKVFMAPGLRSLRQRFLSHPSANDGRRESRRLVLGVTSDTSMILLRGAPEYFRDHGWDVHVVCAPGPNARRLAQEQPGISAHGLPMNRDLSPFHDVVALVRWVALLHRLRPDVVSVGTPKAGLLGSIAARLTGVPFRVYVLRGLRFETVEGAQRSVLRAAEVVAARCSHVVRAVSYSLRESAVDHGVAPFEKIRVIGAGSSNGVEIPERDRAPHSVSGERPLTVGFVGRATLDKGVDLLIAAVEELAARGISGTLLVIGAIESDQAGNLLDSFSARGWQIERHGHVEDVGPMYERMTLLALPTKREGFPNVVLEAAVHGVPCVATRATGVPDAIISGVTGQIVDHRNPRHFADAIEEVGCEPGRAKNLGDAARERAERLFSRETVHRHLELFYRAGAVGMEHADQPHV